MSSSRHVKQILMSAFADVECPFSECGLSDHYWIEIREHLFALSADELHWVLPRVLVFLIDDQAKDYLDLVVSHLDVRREVDDPYYKRLQARYGVSAAERSRAFAEEMAGFLQSVYSTFTSIQARAILEWLMLTRTWPEYLFFEHTIESAVSYWSGRCRS